ncbi:MAG TPA: SWIM zinc finger family protein [Acidiferrobacter sp.]|nr:SWIM zinc finger family protein [Acidiferrobacter sp.]
MSYYGWKPYVSVAQRRKKAEKAAAKAKKTGVNFSPIESYRGAIAKTFWGKAWCENLEGYSDYANRLPRGRTYARNGSIIHLAITEGEVQAQVMGSALYTVTVHVAAVPVKQWQAIGADCASSIDSLIELLQGKLSTAVMKRICTPGVGLFPGPKEIRFSCSCPDWASMCKHIAAVLYGVGARLDQRPELLFSLRRVDAKDLISQAGVGLQKPQKRLEAGKALDHARIADVFGIEMDETHPPKKDTRPQKAPPSEKKSARKAASEPAVAKSKKSGAKKKTATVKKLVGAKPPTGSRAGLRKLTVGRALTAKPQVTATTLVKKKRAGVSAKASKP